nr:pyridoxal-phosphate dependent enzyme [Caballeronia calidae]
MTRRRPIRGDAREPDRHQRDGRQSRQGARRSRAKFRLRERGRLAWRVLERCIDRFMLIDDSDAIDAMKTLAQGVGHDVPIVAGESGAAGFAGLVVSMRDRELARSIGLDAKARVLVINTEGATAPGVYARLVGASAEEVSARQREWLKRAAG